MSINIFNLEKVIAQKIETATSADDIVYLTSALKQLKNGQLIVVQNFSELPVASTVPLGSLYFVVNDKIVYQNETVGSDTRWVTLIWDNYSQILNLGSNSFGQLGDNSTVNKTSAVPVVGGFTDWSQISSGRYHRVGLRKNGTLWAWGRNFNGRLGDGTTVDKSSPVSVLGGLTDWCQVDAGGYRTFGVRTNGTLWGWGPNNCQGLGNSLNTETSSPTIVIGGFTDWCQVSAGNLTTAAVRQNGTLWTWGFNFAGQLGIGTTTPCAISSPVSVIGGLTGWCQVSGSKTATTCEQHIVAVRTNGTLWAWGWNGFGKLGDGTTSNQCSPVSVIGGFTDWCQVAAGNQHTVALRQNGTLWTWGRGGYSQLGNNSILDSSSPVSVVGGFTDWCQVSANFDETRALRTNGTLWVWGRDFNDSSLSGGSSSSPVSYPYNQGIWCSVSGPAFIIRDIK